MYEENKSEIMEEVTPQEEAPQVPQEEIQERSSSGSLIGVAIIIIVLVAGGIYFWSTAVGRDRGSDQLPTIQSGGEVDAIVNQLNSQGTSDEVADIEADLNTTGLDNLDSELSDLLNEL